MSGRGFRPTLLVGVGGTGSRVAEKILRRLKHDSIKRATEVGILCFDTDLNDISLLEEVERRDVVQFSNNLKVFRLLDRNPGVEESWMPARGTELHSDFYGMDMIDGAKQIRMLTRLALWDCFAHSDIYSRMQNAIARLARHSQDGKYDEEINILVFGSFAGATGSGSYLQIALALRNAARERGVSCKVRGMFTLPDVYARSNALPRDQIPNVLANGYASLKELNAINVLVSRPERNARFDFEYMPGERVRPHEMPYDFMTFIDFESTNGGNMGAALANYEEMVARSGYTMIFTPLGAKFASSGVNNTLQQLEAAEQGTHNLYSGIGVAAVAYPAESTKEYLKLRLVHENLKGDWTRLDQMFREAMSNYQKSEAMGGTESEPDIVENYIDNLKNLAQDENIAFFRRVWDRLHPEVRDEKNPIPEIVPRHITYLDALFAHVKKSFWNSDRLVDAKERQPMDATVFKNKGKITHTVKQAEQWLDEDYRQIERELAARPEEIFRNTTNAADNLNEQEWRPHHIQSYLIKDGPHPVEVRAFLYLLRQEISSRLDSLNTMKLRYSLFNLAGRYRTEKELMDAKGEPGQRSTPNVHKVAEEAAGGGGILGMFGGKGDDFGSGYAQYFNQSLQQMKSYSDGMIAEKLLQRLRDEVDSLIRVFFGLFNEVETIGHELRREIEIERDKYTKDAAVNDGSVWVYADRACREDAWERLEDMAAGLKLDANVNKSVVGNVYEKYRADQRERRKSSFADINAMFRREVVENFGKNAIEEDFRGAHDFTVIEALRRQEAVRSRESDTDATGVSRGRTEDEEQEALIVLLRDAVDRVARQSEPYLTLTNRDSDGLPIKYWALNPRIQLELNNKTAFTDIFSFSQEDKPLEEEDFSPYELLCINLRVNLKLEDLKKLHHGKGSEESIHATEEGRLYKEYQRRIDDLINAQANATGPVGKFTPHIDKTWHKRGGLPQIFSSEEPGIEEEQNKAYTAAICLNMLKFDTEYGDRLTRFDMHGKALRNSFDQDLVKSHDLWQVYQAFIAEPHIVSATNEGWLAIASRGDDLEQSEGFKALFDEENLGRLFEISAVRKDEAERDRKTGQILNAWMDLVAILVDEQRGDMGAIGRVKLVQQLIKDARDKIIPLFRQAGVAAETVRVYEREFNTAFDKRFQG